MEWLWNGYGEVLLIISLIISVISLILFFVVLVQLIIVKRRMNRFFGKGSDKHDLEILMNDVLDRADEIQIQHNLLNDRITALDSKIGFCIQKTGLVRFNPFKDMGGDLSFALALLDEHNNGIVISSLYGREACYTYCKTISDGEASHILSPEEEKATEIAKSIVVGNA